MTTTQYYQNLTPPKGKIDVVLDTDAFNEIDDQFAISYLLRAPEKFNLKGLCAAPFFNINSTSPADGMEKSYQEIFKLLKLAGEERYGDIVYRGSTDYLPDEKTPVPSPAADFMADLAKNYSPEHPLYIVAIGAITNVASAILQNPEMKETCVLVWLGGHGTHMPCGASEFNMRQDIAAARVIFDCGMPVVQLPCKGVVDHCTLSRHDLEYWLKGKDPLCTYLADNTIEAAEKYAAGTPWTRVIWDITTLAWLIDEDGKFMNTCLIPAPIPQYDQEYSLVPTRHPIAYVYHIQRDKLFTDLFRHLTK